MVHAVKREPRPARSGEARSQADPGPLSLQIARDYQTVALILQGGGALGAYQAGVYQGLHQAAILPTWFAGISIGAINAAILAGNAPEDRLERLDKFWKTVCQPALIPTAIDLEKWLAAFPGFESLRSYANWMVAQQGVIEGQLGFFYPRFVPPWFSAKGTPEATSFYDTHPLKSTLEALVDFDRIRHGDVRLSVGAVNVRTGNFTYFDSAKKPLRAEHIMASAALPPGFPAVEIEGEFYWDGGVVSNTPLEFVFDEQKRSDTLAFQVDLWSAQGALPQTIADVLMRQKDIQYSSRTRRGTDEIRRRQHTRCQVAKLLDKLDGELRNDALVASLREWSKSSLYNVVHLIYQSKSYEGDAKDYQFGVTSMLEHWRAGLTDIDITLRRRDYFALPSTDTGITTHDIHRNGGR